MSSFEKTYSAEETAQILGLCLDSVRRHFRAGKLPGVRVGRNWRIAESQLASYMGLETVPSRTAAPAPTHAPRPSGGSEGNSGVIAPLLRTAPVRAQIIELVHQAAVNSNLRPRATQNLLEDLDVLLSQK